MENTTKFKIFPKQNNVSVIPYAKKSEQKERTVVAEIKGFKAPETAYTREYVDKKCPFTGDVKVNGKVIKAEVKKMKADKTIVAVINYLYFNKKYMRYGRRHTNISVHLSPCWDGIVNVGDIVYCGSTRPLSKTKSSCVIGHEKKHLVGQFKRYEAL